MFNPHYGNIEARYTEEGCSIAMIKSYDYNEYGGTLRLVESGYEQGDIITIFFSANSGNAGFWLIQTEDETGWTTISTIGPWGAESWVGSFPMWMRNFVYNGSSWE